MHNLVLDWERFIVALSGKIILKHKAVMKLFFTGFNTLALEIVLMNFVLINAR